MMRKMWIALLALLLCLPALAEEPQTYTEGEWEYTVNEDGTATLTGLMWRMLDEIPPVVEVPATLGGHPLRRLGDNVFNTSMTNVEKPFRLVIPEGVADCEGDPFLCLHDAAEIVFPSTFVGNLEGCFSHVYADIIVADGNPAFEVRDGYLIDARTDTLVYTASSVGKTSVPAVKRIGDGALANWGGNDWSAPGVTLVIPEGVKSIGSYVIFDSIHISKLILPDSLTALEPQAFYCVGLTEVQFGSGLTRIPELCFAECFDLTNIVLPENITFVGYWAFDEEVAITALNPDCHFETEEEFIQRTGEEPWW